MTRPLFAVLVAACLLPAGSAAQTNPFVGRWDFDVPSANDIGANWLGVTNKGGQLEVWFQPTGGHVYRLKQYKLNGSHLTLRVSEEGRSPETVWELDATGGELSGIQKRGAESIPLTGVRAPALERQAPASWSNPEPLFDGKDLDGWEPIGDVAHDHWTVENGLLTNQERGANLESKRKFDDFKLHFEVNCPDDANSGFYLRGRYELQLEYEALSKNPPERSMGSIYGRIAPSVVLPRTPGRWETFDVTLVGRTVSVVRNGKTTIDKREIEGITGGALSADEGEPGPFYIQGDHTGGLKFRNITVSLPQ